jgi:hypothetical protein
MGPYGMERHRFQPAHTPSATAVAPNYIDYVMAGAGPMGRLVNYRL